MLILEDVRPLLHRLEPVQVTIRFSESHIDDFVSGAAGNLFFRPTCNSSFKNTRSGTQWYTTMQFKLG
jgi:hypothetical protein